MLRVMSEEKPGTVKYELSRDGDLKCKIKREKTVEYAEWVTENRGNGLGKLVFKKKSPTSSSQSSKASGLHADRQTEQVPVLRLSLTPSLSSDRNRQVQVKSWSLCEPEDVGSMSEQSPSCQLQQSPKDSGVDMSSPPHDDGAVSVEPNVATGIWSVNDSHNGDSSTPEDEKTASSLEKLETAVGNFDDAVHTSTKALWTEAASCSSESDRPKVRSTLRSRVERSVLKHFPSNSQKLINPLAKAHRVGRYQHMLPVHRIRAESNVSRRSSLEESPTYNMVAPLRTTSASRLPRVKTKLKLLSNNTYTAVHQEVESNRHQVAGEKSKCLNAENSSSAVVECKRNRLLHKSSASNAFENMKIKLCYSDKNNCHGPDCDRIQRLPKIKLVVKSERAVSVSCVAQQQDNKSVAATVKHDEENMPRHIWQKRRQCEVEKTKVFSNNTSTDLCHPVNSSSRGNLPSSKAADGRSSHRKRKSLEAKPDAVADIERSGKKKKVQNYAQQPTSNVPALSNSPQLLEGDDVDKTVQSISGEVPVDEAVCPVVTTHVHTDKLVTDQKGVNDASNEAHAAVQEETVNTECSSDDQSKSSAASTELDSNGTGAAGRVEGDKENQCSNSACCDSEILTVSNLSTVNADDERSKVDGMLEEKVYPPCPKKEMPDADVQHDSAGNYGVSCGAQAVITEKPCMFAASISDDDWPTSQTYSDHDKSRESQRTYAVFHEDSMSSAARHPTAAAFSETVVPLLPLPLLPDDNPVAENITCTLVPHSYDGVVNSADAGNLPLTLKHAEVTENGICYDFVQSQNINAMADVHGPIDTSKLCHQDTECVMECQQDAKQEMADAKELSEKSLELKSVCSLSDQDVGLEHIDDDSVCAVDIPSHLMPLSPSCCSAEHTETPVFNSACSNGFLAAFTQFVNKASSKKKSASCVRVETDNSLKSTEEILSKSDTSQKCVRQRPCDSVKRRRLYSERQALSKNSLLHHAVRRKSTSTVEHSVTEKSSLLERSSSEDAVCPKRLTCTAVDNKHLALSREQLLNAVAADHSLVTLRHRVCELVETVLPEFQFPPGFRRDSFSVERLIKDITDILSNSEAHGDVQQCSDPVVVLHHMPDKCLQSLQQQVIRLISLVLPDTDLSAINGDSVEVFLELLTSVNRPLPETFRVSQPNLHLHVSHETFMQPLDKVQIPGQQLLPYHAETDLQCEQIDVSLSRTESHMSDIDAVFSMPSCLLPVNLPSPVNDKRSIRRQVKDCLMFLDRDLT